MSNKNKSFYAMRRVQRIIKDIFELSLDHGFDKYYPIFPAALENNIHEVLFDRSNKTGMLYMFSQFGIGMINMNEEGTHACIFRKKMNEVVEFLNA